MEKKNISSNSKLVLVGLTFILVGAVLGFLGGMKYQQSKNTFGGRFGGGQFMMQRNGINGNNRNTFRPVSGEIIDKDEKSMTIKMQDGSTKIVLFSNMTTFSKSEAGSKEDVAKGTQVAVFGLDNSDGSITAQNVQINPQFRLNMGGK